MIKREKLFILSIATIFLCSFMVSAKLDFSNPFFPKLTRETPSTITTTSSGNLSNISLSQILGVDTNACSPGDFVKNVTFSNGNLIIVCDTPSGSGDITSVNAGTGLFGGATSGDATLNVSASICSSGEVSKYNGTGFVCVTDQAGSTNNTFNQTLTDLLYSPIVWGYNQTTPANSYTDSQVNKTFNQSLTNLLYSSIIWNYNQTISSTPYTNGTGILLNNNKFNLSTAYTDTLYASIIWAYNQTYSGSTFNSTYATFAYNQTVSASSTGNASLVNLSRIGNSTYYSVQHFFNLGISAGKISGGNIIAGGISGQVNVSAGTGFIRIADDDVSTVSFFNWSSLNSIAVPVNTTRYIGINYSNGNPVVYNTSSSSWDYDTNFPLGEVINEAGTLYIMNAPWHTADATTNIIERFDSMATIARDTRTGGLIISNTGTRNVSVTAGQLLSKLEEFPISAIDTSSSSRFDSYYRDGSGGWNKQPSQSQWNNTVYDNGAGGFTSISLLAYSNRWFYLMTDGSLAMVYGQADYTSLATALAESPPSSLPQRITEMGILIGRITAQQGTNTPAAVQTTFTTPFSANFVANHNDLAGLQGGSASEYYHFNLSIYNLGLSGIPLIQNIVGQNCPAGKIVNGSLSNGTFICTTASTAADFTNVSYINNSEIITGNKNFTNNISVTNSTGVGANMYFNGTYFFIQMNNNRWGIRG